jgi:ribosomal protein L40E
MPPGAPDGARETAQRCPSCGASVRPDAPWCTQCFHDFRPAPPPADPEPPAYRLPPAEPRVPAAGPPPADPLTAPLDASGSPVPPATAEPTWPCTTCGAANPLTADACAACGSGFLASVRDGEAPLLVLPGVGDLSRYGRGQRLALAGGVVLAFVLATLVLGLLLS